MTSTCSFVNIDEYFNYFVEAVAADMLSKRSECATKAEIVVALLCLPLLSTAQRMVLAPGPQRLPSVQIVEPVDEERLTKLKGNTIPFASLRNDRGAISSEQPMHRMLLLLRRSEAQDTTLGTLMRAQQNLASSIYHTWLTPEQFGYEFGPAQADVQTVTNWLSSHRFTGISLTKGGIAIEFSGTAGQVRSAFHTEIHRYDVNGAMHLANDRDPSIPSALAPVIAGVVSLNDFGRRSMAIRGPTLTSTKDHLRPQISSSANPDYTLPGPTGYTSFFGVGAYDFATIYDLVPLWNQGLDGTGQTIAVVGETDINLNDAADFRVFMGLPANNPSVLIAGADPGFQQDELESDLDVEWAGAVAKGAHIELVSAASTETTPGVDLAALYVVDNNLAPVMSESYGQCELFLGTTGNAFEKALYQQAAAEGITVLISSGDEGSTECDPTSANQDMAVHPMAVTGLASTPYDVAVGGTDFNQYGKWDQYWSNTNDASTKKSVLGYIPEIPWNDSCGSSILDATFGEDPAQACDENAGVTNLNTIATGGGPSSCVTSDGSTPTSCTGGWPKPVWQAGTGVPADGVRDIPDVSFFASNGVYNSAYVVCDADATPGASCDPNAASQAFVAVGGTSAGAPAMAGVMAIINQKYGRQGNANYTLYRLASSAAGPTIFHDVTADGNRVACNSNSPDCQIPGSQGPIGRTSGQDSTVGYDMVTGLGSIDIANLVNNWTSASFASTKTTLDLNGGLGTVTAAHGSPISATANVSSTSGNPTGDVSLIGATANGALYLGKLQSGTVYGSVNTLPGGNYAVTAHYGGDTQFAPSDSSAVNVNISPEPSTTKLTVLNYNINTGLFGPASSSIPYGSLLLVRADIKGQSGYGNATGSAQFIDGTSSLGTFAINSEGFTEVIPNDLLLAGARSLKASYTGDASFNASSSGPTGFTITPAPMACTLGTNTVYVRPGWDVVVFANAGLYQAKLAPALGTMIAPTGTMSVYSGSTLVSGPTTASGHGSAPSNGFSFQLPAASIPSVTIPISQLTSPTAPITITYSGDPNYAGCTSDPLVLTYDTSPVPSQVSFTLSAYQNILQGASLSMSATVATSNVSPPYEPPYPTPTGTVQLAIDGVSIGGPVPVTAGPAYNGNLTGLASLNVPTMGLSNGNHIVTLAYSGDSNYKAANSFNINISVVVPDFSVSPSIANLTVTNGSTTVPVTIQIGYMNGFAGTVGFSCSGLPSESSCVFAPTTLTNSGSTSLTIATTRAQSVEGGPSARVEPHHPGWFVGAGSLSLACFIVLVIPKRRRMALLAGISVSSLLVFGAISCGGGSGGSSGTTGPSQFSTQTALTATTKTPAEGSTDTFTATVTPLGSQSIPTGTVQFSVDGTPSGSPIALSNGVAQFQALFSVAGTHSVLATYSGDTTDLSSKSSPFSVSVPYASGSIPGSYAVTVTAKAGSTTHSAIINLLVQ